MSFTKAAEELFVTQSSVSQSMAQLEKKLDIVLFHRTNRRVSLTHEGEMLFSHVSQAINIIKAGERILENTKVLEYGELKLGASDTICKYFLLPYFSQFHRTYPKIRINITNQPSIRTIESVRKGELDFGIINLPYDSVLKDLNVEDPLTLFCERIDLLSIPLQQKLLSILLKSPNSNKQFIASIGDDPVELIASGTLLKELYYFFASFTIRIPPLRKRKEDILPFISAYLERRSERYGSALKDITPEVEHLFLGYEWPGNTRELEFLLDEISSLAMTETAITYDLLPLHFRMKSADITDEPTQAADFIVQPGKELLPLDQFLRDAEAYYLQKAMKLNDRNVTKTANALGMSRQNLQYRLRKLKK